ncbi:hypothetical protein B296_00019421 [Ensete ventricosum]|uniref:NAC domain-containing protein n=1 Tax=Ensete ventricosum TaxID=4639 RepID=A0A427AET0_ENSVE|nr:hypothetical protein B296_00019421 [Ensete ventricosum]
MRTLIQKKEKGGGEKIVMEEMMAKREEEEDDVVLPGFRFHPTDEELVGFYLRRKVEKKKTLGIDIIKEMDIYKHDPWNLPSRFSCLIHTCANRKYRNSVRPNRVTGSGFWKATGIDKTIHSSGDCIGLKKSLVYYRGSAGKGTKTDWMMHEFRLPSGGSSIADDTTSTQEAVRCARFFASSFAESSPRCVALQEIWTICRIFKRSISYRKQSSKWKASSTHKRAPADSSCVTSSFECDNGSDYRCCASSGHSCSQEHNQVHGWQCNSISQPPSLYSDTVQSPSTNEFFRDGDCWDELGRMMEFMADQSIPMSVDTARGMYHAY